MKHSLFLILTLTGLSFFNFSSNAQSGIITTIAGNGTAGYSGDGGPATVAELRYTPGVAIDRTGNIYIADYSNNLIRKVSTAGIITTIAGNYASGYGYSGDGGPATIARLNDPVGVTIDGDGNVYIADAQNYVIRKVDTLGVITTIAGSTVGYSGDGGPATSAKMSNPSTIAFDAFGNFYFADGDNQCIRKVDTSGIITTVAGYQSSGGGYSGDGGPATAAQLQFPGGVALDGLGNLFIADGLNNVIRKVNTSGIITTVAGGGHIYTASYAGDGGPATDANLYWPSSVLVDASGNLYISDFNNQVVRKVNTSGIISTVAGNGYISATGYGGYTGDGAAATAAELSKPTSVALDSSGNLYIADQSNSVIRKVSTVIPSGVKQIISTNKKIAIRPNPNNGTFTINGSLNSSNKENVAIEVMNMLGQVVTKNDIIAQNGTINAKITLSDNLPNGLYFLYLNSEMQTNNIKFIINR